MTSKVFELIDASDCVKSYIARLLRFFISKSLLCQPFLNFEDNTKYFPFDLRLDNGRNNQIVFLSIADAIHVLPLLDIEK